MPLIAGPAMILSFAELYLAGDRHRQSCSGSAGIDRVFLDDIFADPNKPTRSAVALCAL
jgi:hypothetical protein